MIVYRIVREDLATLDGKGAAEYPGRWNKHDVPCVYTSASPSLAQLEKMVNVDDWKIFITIPHLILCIEVPDNKVHEISESDLPPGWDNAVYSLETQEMGTNLLNNPSVTAFSIPSAVSKMERNIILNPRSSDYAARVKAVEKIPFEFDAGLLKGKLS